MPYRNIEDVLRSSEFWVALAAALGSVLVRFHFIQAGDWAHVFWPAIVYAIGRLTSKFAKKI